MPKKQKIMIVSKRYKWSEEFEIIKKNFFILIQQNLSNY